MSYPGLGTAWRVLLAWVATAGLAIAQPTTQPGTSPFLTAVKLYEIAGNQNVLGEPEIGSTIDPKGLYWDQPFAFNVPVEQPFEGGNARISIIVRERWENDKLFPGKGRMYFSGNTHGVYPLDGKPFEKDTVRWAYETGDPIKQSPRSTTRPIYLTTSSCNQGPEQGKHLPFTDSDGKLRYGDSLFLSPARPGWYVFWWQVAHSQWPVVAKDVESFEVTLLVDVMVSRGGVAPDRLEYLLGRGPKPSWGEFDEKSVRITTHELKITFIKGGWTFHRVEVKPQDVAAKHFNAKGPIIDDYYAEEMKVASTVNAGGPSVSLQVTTEMLKKPNRGKPGFGPVVETMGWRVDFPQVVLDRTVTDVVITPTRSLKPEKPDPPDISAKNSWFGDWQPDVRGTGIERLFGRPTPKKEFLQDIKGWAIAEPSLEKHWLDEAATEPKLGEPVRTRFWNYAGGSYIKDGDQIIPAREKELFKAECGPWDLIAYYRRLKDTDAVKGGGQPQITDVKIVDELDPYWPWYVEFHTKMKGWQSQLKAVEREAAITANTLEIVRRDADLLAASVANRNITQTGEDPLETHSDRTLRKAVEWVWDCLPDMPAGADPVKVSEQAFQKKILKIRELREEVKGLRNDLDAMARTQQKVYDEIVQEIEKASQKHTTKHPHLITWQREYEEEREQLGLRWALVTSDRDALMRELERIKILAVSAPTRVLEGQIHQNEGDAIAALVAYRSAVRIDEKNPDAVRGLKEVECALLRSALAKSQGTVKIARENFNRYMRQRGFRMDRVPEPPATRPAQPLANIHDKRAAVVPPTQDVNWPLFTTRVKPSKEFWEAAYAVVTTGIVGAISAGIYDRPGAEADLLNAYEEEMARAFMGLHMLIWLREQGHRLDEIITVDTSKPGRVAVGGATSEKIKSWLPKTDMHGKPWTDESVRKLAVCIHEAARLDEVMALLQKDDIALRIAMEKQSYWNKRDISSTWWEWVGDFTSMKELFTLLLPYSVHTTAPRLSVGLWSARDAAFAARLQATGRAVSGTEAVFRATGWAYALDKIGKTQRGAKFALMINKYRQRVDQAGTLGKAYYTLRGTMAMMILQSAAAHAGDKWDMPMLPLIVEALLLFGNDTEHLAKFLGNPDLPTDRIVDVVRKQLLPSVEIDEKRIATLRYGVDELKSLAAKVKGTGTLKGPEFVEATKNLATLVEGAPKNPKPVGSALHDIEHPLTSAKDDIGNGVNTGSVNATEAISEGLVEESENLKKLKTAGNNVIAVGDNARKNKTLVVKKDGPPPPPKQERLGRAAPAEWYLKGASAYGMPVTPAHGSLSARGLAALDAGDFDNAEAFLRKAREEVLAGNGLEDELTVDTIDLYLNHLVADRGRSALPSRTLPPNEIDVSKPINDAEMEAALALPREALGDLGGVQGSKYKVGNGEYFLKEITVDDFADEVPFGDDQDTFRWLAENELVRATVYESLGLGHLCPGVNVKMHLRPSGRIEKLTIVYRGIRGEGLNKLTPAQLWKLRKELSMCRVADMIIADFDRKPANFMLHGEGRVQSVDGGFADVRGQRHPARDERPVDHPRYMEGYLGMDHYWTRMKDKVVEYPDDVECRGAYLIEYCLTYDAAKETIAKAEKMLLTAEGKAALREKLVDHYRKVWGVFGEEEVNNFVNQAVDCMAKRGARLDKVLQRLNMRQGLHIKPLHSSAGWPRLRFTPGWMDTSALRRAA